MNADPAALGHRLTELAARYGLSSEIRHRLERLLELLCEDPLAPTAIRDRARALDDHLADALVALELPAVRRAASLADIGSGAGLPGLPLALALTGTRIWLVESAARACRFIERAVIACAATNVVTVHGRVEEWHAGAGRCDVVTARALSAPAVVAEYAAPLLRVGGTLVMWRGKRDRHAEELAARAGSILGLEPASPVAVSPYEGARNRHLHTMVKVAETPAGFPRRPGIARKRPLGAD